MEFKISPEEAAKLYDEVDAKQAERGVKGEKSGIVREVLKAIISAKQKKGINELSQATLRNSVILALSPKDKDGKIVEETKFNLDQSHFTTIINSMFETRRDEKTQAVIVMTNKLKAPKVRQPRKKKAEATPAPK